MSKKSGNSGPPDYMRKMWRGPPFLSRHDQFDESGRRIWVFDIYERVSTPAQAKGAGFDRQEQKCISFLNRKAIPYREIHQDVHSGFDGSRQSLSKLFAAAEDGLINGVVLEDLTRLARKGVLVKKLLRQLLRLGVRVISIDEELDITELSESTLNLAAFIVDKKTENLASTMNGSPRTTKPGPKYIGVTWNKDKYCYEPNKDFQTIQFMHDKKNQGKKPKEIAKLLVSGGYPSPRGAGWSKRSVENYLGYEVFKPFLRRAKKKMNVPLTLSRKLDKPILEISGLVDIGPGTHPG